MEVKVGDMVRIDNDPEWYEVSRVTSHSFCVGDGPLFPFYYIYERITDVPVEPEPADPYERVFGVKPEPEPVKRYPTCKDEPGDCLYPDMDCSLCMQPAQLVTILLTENEAQCEWLKHWPIELDREYLNSIRLHVCRAQLRKVYEVWDRCESIPANFWKQLRKEAGL